MAPLGNRRLSEGYGWLPEGYCGYVQREMSGFPWICAERDGWLSMDIGGLVGRRLAKYNREIGTVVSATACRKR